MSEDEVKEKVQKFGFQLRNQSPEEIAGVHTDKKDDGTAMSFAINSEKKVFFKVLSVMRNYNGEDIDEVFEQHTKIFLEAVNMDLKDSLLANGPGDNRMINLYLSGDNNVVYHATVHVSIIYGLITVGYSLTSNQETNN